MLRRNENELNYQKNTFLSGIDLALLSQANHSIMTLGTFGMWGALLAGGHCLMPLSHKGCIVNKHIILANLTGWELV
jgi:hypothetical protein